MKDKSFRVLVIDDEEMVSMILRDFLEDQGFTVVTIDRGKDGLDLVQKEKFDAAIIDMRLPDMDGDDFIIRCNEMQPGIKYFIHTGSLDYRISEDLKQIGMKDNSILYKPVSDMNSITRAILESLSP